MWQLLDREQGVPWEYPVLRYTGLSPPQDGINWMLRRQSWCKGHTPLSINNTKALVPLSHPGCKKSMGMPHE